MDGRLNVRPAPDVLARIARRWLQGAAVPARLGSVTLAAHQIDAAERLLPVLHEYGGALLADSPGMGKTYVALAVGARLQPFAVVAPAALRKMWLDSLQRAALDGTFHSMEALARAGAPADRHPPRLVIVDEAHHARNPRTRRYEALAALTRDARVLLLSATPLHNATRDLTALFALFLGSAAATLDEIDLSRLLIRRHPDAVDAALHLPRVAPMTWLAIPDAPEVMRAMLEVPPAVPSADGGVAHALMRLGLLRAWASSDAALREMLRRRLLRAAALSAALDAGRWPTRRDLAAWASVDGALQLAFPELLVSAPAPRDGDALRTAIARHVSGIDYVRGVLEASPDLDGARAEHLRRLRRGHEGVPIVAFTAFAETARGLYRRLRAEPEVALVTARGARIASGAVSREEVLRALAPVHRPSRPRRGAISLLLATDVLSEGLDLQRAGVLVHLDLPWTAARLEQRVGRLRRPRSPNDSVAVHAMAPPGGRRLRPVWQALRRKARLMHALSAATDLDAHHALLGAGGDLERPRSAARDPAARAEELRARMAGFRGAVPLEESNAGGAPLVGWLHARAGAAHWTALALADVDGQARLARLSPAGPAEKPASIVAWLDDAAACLVAPVGATECLINGEPPAHVATCLREAVTAAARWLAGIRGASLITDAFRAPSPEHRRTLRLLDAIVSDVPRQARSAAAQRAARLRDLVLRARGAGAERALATWIRAVEREAPAAMDPLRQLDALFALLKTGAAEAQSGNGAKAVELGALVVLVPRPAGA